MGVHQQLLPCDLQQVFLFLVKVESALGISRESDKEEDDLDEINQPDDNDDNDPMDDKLNRMRKILFDLSNELGNMSEDMTEFADKIGKVVDTFAKKL